MSEDLHGLSGAYVLDALSETEAQSFRRHLGDCPACRQEVHELQETAAQLGAGQSQQPPAHLKVRVMSAVDQEPQLPRQPPHPGSGHDPGAGSRRWMPRLGAAAAAVLLAVAVGIGISQWLQPDGSLADEVVAVFEASDAQTVTAQTRKGSDIRVAVSESLDRMALDSDQLRPLGDQRVYQLWTLHDGVAKPAGLLTDPDRGVAMEMPAPGVKVAITVEPEGGSQQPTSKPIVVLTPGNA